MTDRAYTVREIDDLRQVMDTKYIWGTYRLPLARFSEGRPTTTHMSRSYNEVEKTKVVEEWVRTAMLAGHTAADFE